MNNFKRTIEIEAKSVFLKGSSVRINIKVSLEEGL